MNIIFTAIVILGLIVIFIRVRKFDAFSIAFAGAVIYLSPGFFGVTKYFVVGRWITTDIADTTYYIMIAFILWVVVSAYLYDKVYTKKITLINEFDIQKKYGTEKYQLMFLFVSSVLGIIYQFLVSPQFVNLEKSEMMSSLGRGHIVFEFCAIYGFCYAMALKQKLWAIIFFSLLLFDAYIGFRFGLGVGLGAAVGLNLFRKKPESFIFKNKLKILISVFILSVLFVYKQFAWGVKAGEFGMLIDMVSNGDVLIRAFDEMEPFVITNNLNQIVLSNYYYAPSEFVISIIRGIMPIGFLLGNEGGFAFQNDLFSDVNYGLAGNMLGEIWSVFGVYGIPFFLIFYTTVLTILNKGLFSKRVNSLVLISILIVVFAVYFHRNTFEFQFLIMRRFFIIYLLLEMFHQLLLMVGKRIRPYNQQALSE